MTRSSLEASSRDPQGPLHQKNLTIVNNWPPIAVCLPKEKKQDSEHDAHALLFFERGGQRIKNLGQNGNQMG